MEELSEVHANKNDGSFTVATTDFLVRNIKPNAPPVHTHLPEPDITYDW